jgi:hypothetical protein
VLLAGSHERQTDSRTTVFDAHSEPVHVSPPAIRCGYQRTYDRAAGVGNEQTVCVTGEQSLQIIEAIGRGGVLAASQLP